MNPADLIAGVWFKHPVVVEQPSSRDALGRTASATRFDVSAAVDGSNQKVTDRNGDETVASATLRWHVDGPLPQPGWKVTLPPEFGLKPAREVITARRVNSGTGMTPDFVEVAVR